MAIFFCAKVSPILLKFVLLASTKEKTATLSIVVDLPAVEGQRISTLSLYFANPSKHNFTNFCSCSRIFCIPPIDLIYSNALLRLTAPMIFGVPASNLSEFPAKVCHWILTSSIVPHPRIIGTSFLIHSFFK